MSYLARSLSHSGNRKTWTWSAWVRKDSIDSSVRQRLFVSSDNAANAFYYMIEFDLNSTTRVLAATEGGSADIAVETANEMIDPSTWFHFMVVFDSTRVTSSERLRFFINGAINDDIAFTTYPSQNYLSAVSKQGQFHYIGFDGSSLSSTQAAVQMTDIYLVDGQALTPDVFGYYKVGTGRGYVSAGSSFSTRQIDGQWFPKSPQTIKKVVDAYGGFGTNGFYLPLNDSTFVGADFHTTPNTIIRMNEGLQQPKPSIASTTTAGLGFTDVLRDDPYASNLVLALPLVSSALCTNGTNSGINTGFGDYSSIIRSSGTHKSPVSIAGSVSIASSVAQYGSAGFFNGVSATNYIEYSNEADFRLGSDATEDFTVEIWANPMSSVNTGGIVGVYNISDSRRTWLLYRDSSNYWRFLAYTDGSTVLVNLQSQVTAKGGQWTHLAVEKNKTTYTLYVDGKASSIQTGIGTAIYNNTSDGLKIGNFTNSASNNTGFDGYLQDLRIYKGVAKYKGNFDVNSHFKSVSLDSWRTTEENVTTNTFATPNPLMIGPRDNHTESSFQYSEGNLHLQPNGTADDTSPTIGITTGKWYYEVHYTTADRHAVGWTHLDNYYNNRWTPHNYGIANRDGYVGTTYINASGVDRVINFSNNAVDGNDSQGFGDDDVLGYALDLDNLQARFYKNGVGIVTTGIANTNGVGYGYTVGSHREWVALFSDVSSTDPVYTVNMGQNPTFGGRTTGLGTYADANGIGQFAYEPPAGHLALCTQNLPEPTIKNPGDYFKPLLYDGNGSYKSVVGAGFTPDLVWFGCRGTNRSHHVYDSVRGIDHSFNTDAANSEAYREEQGLVSFDPDGFTVGSLNELNSNDSEYAAYCWRAGAGVTSSNSDGSTTSVISASQEAGFSVVTYTGTGSAATVGHGLTVSPDCMIIKNRDQADNWAVYYGDPDNFVQLDSDSAESGSGDIFGNSYPTTSVFSVGTNHKSNASSERYVAYCWHEVPGFSRFARYSGSGLTTGLFIHCGFKPAFVMLKELDNAGSWILMDSARGPRNPVNLFFGMNSAGKDDTGAKVDFLSNGFNIRLSSSNFNTAGSSYFFMAFAETPFKYANAK